METWVVAEILMVAMYLVNAGLYVRARKRGMTGLRRQQYMTAFWVGGGFIVLGALHLMLHQYQ